MALNPQLIRGEDFLYPANKGNELTYLKRDGMRLKLFLPSSTIKEDGMVFLTSTRLVFVKNMKSKTNANFKALEMPLNLIESPKFEQPVFGMNYMCGIIKPLRSDPNCLQEKCKWHLIFVNGNTTSFLSMFSRVYEESKKNKPFGCIDQPPEQFLTPNNAYIDPNDPSYIYINEPVNPNLYQPQNITQNHYVPMPVPNANINNMNYYGASGNSGYGNNGNGANASGAGPLISVTDQTSLAYGNMQGGYNNNMLPHQQQHNSISSQIPPMQNSSQYNVSNPSYYTQQPIPNMCQPNQNIDRRENYNTQGQQDYNAYNQQNYRQQQYMPLSNDTNQRQHITPSNMGVSYQQTANAFGGQQPNMMNMQLQNSQQQNQTNVTELTNQNKMAYNIPYQR